MKKEYIEGKEICYLCRGSIDLLEGRNVLIERDGGMAHAHLLCVREETSAHRFDQSLTDYDREFLAGVKIEA